MSLLFWLIIAYLIIGLGMALWDFRPSNALHDPPRFVHDRSVSTADICLALAL